MRYRLENIPIYETDNIHIDADYYNLVRLSLLRLHNPLRVRLSQLRTIDLLLDDETWIAVDRTHNDEPVVAFLDFATVNRDELTAPVLCTVNYYHAQATIMTDHIFEATYRLLNKKLLQLANESGHEILKIKRPA